MKTIRDILMVLFCLFISLLDINAQSKMDGVYKKDNNLDKFVGTWQWVSGDSSLTMILIKTQYNLKKDNVTWPDASGDVIIGWHEFSVKNNIIENSIKFKKDYYDYAKKDFTILCMRNPSETNDFRMRVTYFKDLTVKNSRNGFITMLPSNSNTITMDLHDWIRKEVPVKFTFPGKLVLKRIK